MSNGIALTSILFYLIFSYLFIVNILAAFIWEADKPAVIIPFLFIIYCGQQMLYIFGPIVTMEYFGEEYFGRLWGTILFISGIFAMIVNVIFGWLYDKAADPGSWTCYGVDCFETSSKLLTLLNTSALLTSTILWLRRKRL